MDAELNTEVANVADAAFAARATIAAFSARPTIADFGAKVTRLISSAASRMTMN